MTTSNPSNQNHPAWQINTLAESANKLAEQGDVSAAAAIYEQILAAAPHNVQALNFLAVEAMKQGDLTRSVALFERAIQANPKRAALFQNLALAYNEMGKPDLALKAIDKALELRPVFPVALLHKGAILERLELPELALQSYAAAWSQAPELKTEFIDPATRPTLHNLVSRSWSLIKETRRQNIERTIKPLREKHGNAALQRIDECIAVYLGDKSPQTPPDSLQKPEFLFVPGMEPTQFYSPEQFKGVADLENSIYEIRNELKSVLANANSLSPYLEIAADSAPQQWQSLNFSKRWAAYHLVKAGNRHDEHCKACSVTYNASNGLPLADLPGHSPDILFSLLEPDTHIPPHHGLGNYKLNLHLPLIVPPNCGIRVGTETREWQEGKSLVFDDSFEHEAWNRSGEIRAVLIIMIWNPQLTEIERLGISSLISAISSYNLKYRLNPAI